MRAIYRVWIFCALLLPVTIALGIWQLDRAEQKRQMLLNLQEVRDSKAERLSDGNVEPFKPYEFKGGFLQQTVLLDNRIRSGQVGYEVLQPLETETGLILVNRGWVKAPLYRDQLPLIDTPVGPRLVSGYFYQPDGQVPQYGRHEDALNTESLVRLQSLDWEFISDFIGRPMLANKEFRLAAGMEELAYQTGWNEETILPEKHSAYAFQWFALSVTLLVLSAVASWRFWPRD